MSGAGGSFNSGENQDNIAGFNTGNGLVIITRENDLEWVSLEETSGIVEVGESQDVILNYSVDNEPGDYSGYLDIQNADDEDVINIPIDLRVFSRNISYLYSDDLTVTSGNEILVPVKLHASEEDQIESFIFAVDVNADLDTPVISDAIDFILSEDIEGSSLVSSTGNGTASIIVSDLNPILNDGDYTVGYLVVQIPDGTINGDSYVLTYNNMSGSTIDFEYIDMDSDLGSLLTVITDPPTIVGLSDQYIIEGDTIAVQFDVLDSGGTEVEVEIDAPDYITLSFDPLTNSGILSINSYIGSQSALVVLTATNSEPIPESVSSSFNVFINHYPEFFPIEERIYVAPGDDVTLEVYAIDDDGDNVTLSALSLPDYAEFVSTSLSEGVLSITTSVDTESADVAFSITDDGVPPVNYTDGFRIVVNNEPYFDGFDEVHIPENTVLIDTLYFNDFDGDSLSYQIENIPDYVSFTEIYEGNYVQGLVFELSPDDDDVNITNALNNIDCDIYITEAECVINSCSWSDQSQACCLDDCENDQGDDGGNADGGEIDVLDDPCLLPINHIFVNNDSEVWYNVDFDIGGFQWDIDGAEILSSSGGDSGDAGFTISTNGQTLLGFSFTAGYVQSGCGVLTIMDLEGDFTSLSDISFSDRNAVAQYVEYYVPGLVAQQRDLDYIEVSITDPGDFSSSKITTISVYDTYLSGDIRPLLEDLNDDQDLQDPGEFGDSFLAAPDVINILKVSTQAPDVEIPSFGSDLFSAFDVSPEDIDVNGDGDYYDFFERGGDGFIESADVILNLNRATDAPGFDVRLPRRVDLSYPYSSSIEFNRLRQINDTLVVGDVDIFAGNLVQIPIYINRGEGELMSGLVYGLGVEGVGSEIELGSPIEFESAIDGDSFIVNSGDKFISVLLMDTVIEPENEILLGYLILDVPSNLVEGDEISVYLQSPSGSTFDYQVIMIDEGESNFLDVQSFGEINVNIAVNEGWNWLSFNTFNQNMSISSLFSSLGDNAEYIKNQSEYADYYPEFGWFGTLDTINNVSMYKVSMLNQDNLEYLGLPVDVENTILSLNSGWNWIGYTPQFSQEINNAFSNLPNEYGVYLKSQFEYADYYDQVGWFGTLESMDPHLGYQINLNDAVDFTYNNQSFAFRLNQEKDNIQIIDVCDLNVHDYEHNGSITASLFDDDIRLKNSDYTLFAFSDDKCVGYTQDLYFSYTDENIYPLMVYGDNPLKLTFKVLNHTTGDFYDISEGYDYIPDMHIADAISPFKMNISKLPEVSGLNQPYPNPFNPSTTITYDIKEPGHIEIAVYDIQGRKVSELYNGYHESGKQYSLVFDASLYSSGVYFVKLQGNDFSDNKKIIFIK